MHHDAPENLAHLAERYQKRRKTALEALGGYQKQGAISHNVGHMAEMLMDESDRGVVVILASLLEDIILERLMSGFVKLDDKEKKNLTRAGGLLSNFDDKINLAYALGLLDDGLIDSFQIIKAMRNACAHSRRHIDFETDELRNVLALLFDDESAEVIRTSRTSVFLRVCFIAQFVVLAEIVKGQDRDHARQLGQDLLDRILDEAKRLAEKHQASRERRSRQRAKRPQQAPTD